MPVIEHQGVCVGWGEGKGEDMLRYGGQERLVMPLSR